MHHLRMGRLAALGLLSWSITHATTSTSCCWLGGHRHHYRRFVVNDHHRQTSVRRWRPLRGGGGGLSDDDDGLPSAAHHQQDEDKPSSSPPPVVGSSDHHDDTQGTFGEKKKKKRSLLVIMDGFCPYHGGYLANAARVDYPQHVLVVPILSDYLRGFLLHQQSSSDEDDDPAEREHWESLRIPRTDEEWQAWKEHYFGNVDDIEKVAVYCESDSGLAQAEELRSELAKRLRKNDGGAGAQTTKDSRAAATDVTVLVDHPVELPARRHKYWMNQVVAQQTDLPTVRQRWCKSRIEAREFANALLQTAATASADNHPNQNNEAAHQPRVVVKPYRGVGSESVELCSTLSQVDQAWDRITSTAVFGEPQQRHESVLVQEFLQGTEYAVDVVSRQGHHKVAAVWKYDKRPANGAAFCYYQTRVVDADSDANVKAVCDYVQTALSALGVQWGLSHNEVIVTSDDDDDRRRGPVLVEVNCRQHNMDFCPLTMSCIGYNAFDMLLQAYFGDDKDWEEQYPDLPILRAQGCMVHLVNSAAGHLVQVHYRDVLDSGEMDSVLDWEIYPEFLTPGTRIEPTRDIRSDAGWVQLVNENAQALQQDYDRIVSLMPTMFQVEDG